jgi:hypothetical protein
LPLVYKKEKLEDVLDKIVDKKKSNAYSAYDIYQLYWYLQDSTRYYLYQMRTRRFTYDESEFLFDHFDMVNGKLQDAIQFVENPYKSLLQVMDNVQGDYIFGDEAGDADIADRFKIEDAKYEDVPVKWRKILNGFKVAMKNTYDNIFIYDLLKWVSKQVGGSLVDDIYFVNYRNAIANEFTNNTMEEVLANPWLGDYIKKTKMVVTLDNILDTYENMHYYPSTYDIKLMASLAKINLVMIGRKTKRNPDALEVVFNNSNYYIILLYSYDRTRVIDVFDVFCHDKKFLFRKEDLSELCPDFLRTIAYKLKTYDVDIED